MTECGAEKSCSIDMPTKVRPTVGRILLCFDRKSNPTNPVPGIVVHVEDHGPTEVPMVNVHVFGDGENVPCGSSTWLYVPVFDAGSYERGEVYPGWEQWCEWMPYQMAKAAEAKQAA
jgi:hypothetical protein